MPYYDPSGKIVQTTEAPEVWGKRRMFLSFCESAAGIDAINESFYDEVEAMHAAFQKSPFYKNSIPRSDIAALTAPAHHSPDTVGDRFGGAP